MNKIFSKSLASSLGILGLILVCIWIISSRFFFRIDMTSDRLYTLSEGSLNIVKNLEDPVSVKLYFSESLEELPPPFKMFGNRVEEVLREFAAHSDGQLTIEVIDPKPDSDDEVWARKYGIRGIELPSGFEAYLGAVFLAGETEKAIPYLDPRKEEFLEYEIAEAFVKLKENERPNLAILSSLPIDGGSFNPMQQFNARREWAFLSGLKNFFEVTTLSGDEESLPENLKVLILLHPKTISEKMQFLIDQYVLKGGRMIVAVDSFSRIDLASNQNTMMQTGQMPNASSNLERLFQAWGVTFHADQIVGDFDRSTRISAGTQAINYPFFLSLTTDDLNRENKITAHLKQMLVAEPGWFELKKDEQSKLKAEVLLETSANSGSINPSMATFMNPSDLARQLKPDQKKKPLAVLLQGRFKSAFSAAPEGMPSSGFLQEGEQDAAVVLMADVDFLHDSNAVETIPFINQLIVRPRNDNINLLVNSAEFLGGNQDLISIRSSGTVQRPFTKVRELQQQAQERWQSEEEKLSEQLNQLQDKLGELQSQRTDGNRTMLSAEQQSEIQKFREQEAEIRTARRHVRKKLREDIESLGHYLVAINLMVVPSIVSGLGIFMFWRREKRAKGEK